jgi:hypothetical protein
MFAPQSPAFLTFWRNDTAPVPLGGGEVLVRCGAPILRVVALCVHGMLQQ